jgi:heme/copper-type cytochrome/quinol oxidase subunit 3
VLGGVTALGYVLARLHASAAWPAMDALDATSLYWHFMDVLWLYLLAVLALRF